MNEETKSFLAGFFCGVIMLALCEAIIYLLG